MSNKIVSLVVTIFMLMMCMLALLVLNTTNLKQSQNIANLRANNSILSTDGEISSESEFVVRGSSVLSCISGLDIVDSRLSDGEKVYTVDREHELNGVLVPQSVYSVTYNGASTSVSDLLNNIDMNKYYSITYGSGTGIDDPDSITVNITEFNTEG